MARSVADRRTAAIFAGHAAGGLPAWIQQRTRMKFVTIDTAGGPVGCDSVGIDKNERSTVPYTALIAATPLVEGILDDHSTIAATGHDHVEMKMETLVIA